MFARAAQQEETAAADTGRVRLDDRERRGDRDRGIEGIAAGIQNFASRRRRRRMRSRNSRGGRLLFRVGGNADEKQQNQDRAQPHPWKIRRNSRHWQERRRFRRRVCGPPGRDTSGAAFLCSRRASDR
jgi:hypothetical protein